MNELPDIEIVYEALNALYHNPDPSSKERASQWLGDLQKSIFAWKVADQLLHVKRDMESCYFGAQTLRTKIQFAFHELPQEAHTSLRDSMFDHLRQINEHTNTVIVTQLCLALADLLLQMTSWITPIQDLILKFGPKSEQGTSHLWPLLEVLTVLPEELSSRTLRLGANRRAEVQKLFAVSIEDVLRLLDSCLGVPSNDRLINVRLLRCFASWVQLQVVTLCQLVTCSTLGSVFAILSNHQSSPLIHEAASDAVCALLQVVAEQENDEGRIYQDGRAVPSLAELRSLEDSLVESIRNLEPAYHAAVAEEDMDKALNYCRIFTEISEALLHRMLELSRNNNGAFDGGNLFNLLDLVLICVGHHDYEVAEVTFGFWYKLSEDLYHINDDDRTIKFRPFIERLIGALCRHCQMEPDHEGILEEGDDFAGFRLRVSELVKDVVFIVGSASVFKHCFLCIHGQSQMPWESTEASLFIMQAVAKNILPDENEVVPQVVDALLQVPDTAHAAVRHTTLLLLGELSEWVDKHPAVVEPVLHHILRSINEPRLSVAAANALEATTSTCRNHLTSHLSVLLRVVELLATLPINTETAVKVVKGITKVCNRLPPHQVTDAVLQLCKIHVEQLRTICQSEADAKGHKGHGDPVYWLDRLASVFRNLNFSVSNGEPHPCQAVVTYVWPVLSSAFDRFQTDRRVMERCCRCLRFALRLIGQQSAPLLQPLVTQMVALYAAHQHSCFLYLASILVDVYGGEQECVSGLISMLEALLPSAFHLLQEPQGFCQHPDTVDDLFRLFARFLQRTPSAFLRSAALTAIFDCSLRASTLDHRDANSSVMQFLSELVHSARTREEKVPAELRNLVLNSILRPQGPLLVNTLITSSIFSLSTCSLPHVAEVLIEFMLVDRESVTAWVEQTLQNLPRRSASGCIAVLPEQLDDFHNQVLRSQTANDLATALREFARLYR